MNDIIVSRENLPQTIEGLSKWYLVGKEKLKAHKAKIRAIESTPDATLARQAAIEEAQEFAENVIYVEAKMGELLSKIPKTGNTLTSSGGRKVSLPDGISHKVSHQAQTISSNPEKVERIIAEARESEKIATPDMVYAIIKGEQRLQGLLLSQKKTVNNSETPPTLHLADAFSFNPGQVDLLLTDPPYSTDVDDISEFAPKVIELLKYVKDTGRAYIFVGSYPKELTAYLNSPMPDHMQLSQILVWTYRNTLGPSPKNLYKNNWQAILYFIGINAPPLDCPVINELFSVQDINAPDGRLGDRYHSWQKPIEIAERFIRHSTKQGDIIYDPFSCTGTFLLAAAKNNRFSIGCEINKEMINIAISRGITCDLT